MIVPKELSQFEEEEIIIFPYFYFQCVSVEDFTSGAAYNVKQAQPEFESWKYFIIIMIFVLLLLNRFTVW